MTRRARRRSDASRPHPRRDGRCRRRCRCCSASSPAMSTATPTLRCSACSPPRSPAASSSPAPSSSRTITALPASCSPSSPSVAPAAVTAALIGLARDAGRAALPLMLALEALLLAVFVAIILFGPPIKGASDWHGIVAGLFAAMAMGAQSVLVRLLMKGIPQTNVMTGNMTQVGIETTELILAWRRLRAQPARRNRRQRIPRRPQAAFLVLSVAIGFFVGAAAGADRLRRHRPARGARCRRHRRGARALGALSRARPKIAYAAQSPRRGKDGKME